MVLHHRRLLALIDLPEMEAPNGAAPVLDNAPGAMAIAVFVANLGA